MNLIILVLSFLLVLKRGNLLPAEYPEDYGLLIRDREVFDFIIIGAGSAGSLVARRLSDFSQKWRILLIEAGGDPLTKSDVPAMFPTLLNSTMDWKYKNQRDPKACLGMNEGQCVFPRGKCLGGSSSINFMLYVRGNPADYDHWASLGNDGWAYNDVLPYFKKFEKLNGYRVDPMYHSTEGLLEVDRYGPNPQSNELRRTIFEAVKEKKFKVLEEINAESQMGFTNSQATIAHDLRSNTARAFLKGAGLNLFVVKHSLAQKLLIKDRKVYGVEFVRNDRKVTVLSKKEVIVSAGSINTPQLLMLSGIGPKAHLKEKGIPIVCDVPAVGKNLQDHFMLTTMVFQIKSSSSSTNASYTASDLNIFSTNKSPLSSLGLSDLIGFTGWSSKTVPDIEYQAGYGKAGQVQALRGFLKRYNLKDDIIEQYVNEFGVDFLFFIPSLLFPKSSGSILLNSTNPDDPPLIYSNFLAENKDMETLIKGFRLAIDITKTNVMKHLDPKFITIDLPHCRQYDVVSNEWITCYVRHTGTSLFHPVGTCKMGPEKDPLACVNSRLQSRCVKKLRVIDASIMPSITRGNTNCPTIMIGEKGSQMIIDDWSTTS